VEPSAIKTSLIEVIQEIQQLSGLSCPRLDGATRPAIVVPEFRSPIWAVAATLLSERIKAEIPDDTNLFFDPDTKQPLSIDESVAIVEKLVRDQSAKAPK